MRTRIKIFVAVTLLLSALLNFPVIENTTLSYQDYGGYVSWPLLWIIAMLFGESVMATKILIILSALIVVGRI
jgi:hypothetical protein